MKKQNIILILIILAVISIIWLSSPKGELPKGQPSEVYQPSDPCATHDCTQGK